MLVSTKKKFKLVCTQFEWKMNLQGLEMSKCEDKAQRLGPLEMVSVSNVHGNHLYEKLHREMKKLTGWD